MYLIKILLYLIGSIQCEYYIRKFVGYGVNVPQFQDDIRNKFVNIKNDDEPYIGIKEQAQKACQELTQDIKILIKNDQDVRLSFIGISQGGLVARYVFMTCLNIQNYVKRIITYGTPNMGIDKITIGYQNLYKEDNQQKGTDQQRNNNVQNLQPAQDQLTYSQSISQSILDFVANTYVNSTYKKDQCPRVYQHQQGVESSLIAYLNLEGMHREDYEKFQQLYYQLEFFLVLGFSNENMISIPESPLFGSQIRLKEKVTENYLQQSRETYWQFWQNKLNKNFNKAIQNCDYSQDKQNCIEELNKSKQEKIQKFQKFLQNDFYLNDKLVVDDFDPDIMKEKYLKMFLNLQYFDPENHPSKVGEDTFQLYKQQYDEILIPLIQTLDNLYKQRKLFLCAISGYHLQFPNNNLYNYQEGYVIQFNEQLDYLGIYDMQSEYFETLLQRANCNYYNQENFI